MALTQEQLDALPKYKNTAQAVAGKDVIIYVAAVVLIMVFPDLVTFLPKLLKLM